MFRLALIAALTQALLVCGAAARADGLDSLINLELAFRDTILDQPAPERYQALIRDGETTITFVPDLPNAVAKTNFFLSFDWTYDYRYRTRAASGGMTEVLVTVTNIKLKPHLRHVIRLPLEWHRDEIWESRLLGHEFDHVAVSLDPRPRALLVHLCSQLPTYRFSMAAREKPSDEHIRAGIDRQMQRRQAAVVNLVRANYVTLDKVTQSGLAAVQQRQEFFSTLYTLPNLEAEKFPYQKEVAALLSSESYRQLGPRHVPADPATLPAR